MRTKKLKSPRSPPPRDRISPPQRNRTSPRRSTRRPHARPGRSPKKTRTKPPQRPMRPRHRTPRRNRSSSSSPHKIKSPTYPNIFLFTHSNRINCLLKDSMVYTDKDSDNTENIIETLRKNKSNTKHFRKFFNNITFHIRATNTSGAYEITVLDTGSPVSEGNKIGNDDLDYYRDDEKIKYLKIVNDKLTDSLRTNNIKSIVISRHGHGRHNETGLLDAISDARLTDKGIRETKETAQRIKGLILNLEPQEASKLKSDYVFTSELFRTMQTAALFMKELEPTNIRTFYVVRCNHELSRGQLEEDMCNNSLENTINSKTWGDWGKMVLRIGNENYPNRLASKLQSFCNQNENCSHFPYVKLTDEELNCSERNYTQTCDTHNDMFNNISIVFYRHQKKDCSNYAVFDNVRKIISNVSFPSPERKKKKRGMTIRRKSKRFTKRK